MPSIDLTNEQFRKLVEIIHLGTWIANATRTEDTITDYEELEKHVLSHAKEFHATKYIDYDDRFKQYFTTRAFEEKLVPIIERYDEDAFWDSLADRMAFRDLINEIGPVRKLTDSHFNRKYEIEEKYTEEFEKNQLKNLMLQVQGNPAKGSKK